MTQEKEVTPQPEAKRSRDLTREDLLRVASILEAPLYEISDQVDPFSGISVATIISATDPAMNLVIDLVVGKVRAIAINSPVGRVKLDNSAMLIGQDAVTFVMPSERTVSVVKVSGTEISFRQIPEYRLDADLQPVLAVAREVR